MNRAGQQALIVLGPLMQEMTKKRVVGGPLWNRICASITATSPGRGWEPTRGQAQDFLKAYSVSNEALRARWFPERASLFSEDFSKLPETQPADRLEDTLHAAAAALLQTTNHAVEREQRLLIDKAHLAERLGDQKIRRTALVQAVRCNGDNPAARTELARLLLESGDVTRPGRM